MERRVLGFVRQWLKEYKQMYGYYPYASGRGGVCVKGLLYGFLSTDAGDCTEQALAEESFTNLPAGRILRQSWFYRYEWYKTIMYVVDESCTAAAPANDCDGVDDPERSLSFNGEPVSVILISTSEPIVTEQGVQERVGPDLVNYLDTQELLTSTVDFKSPALSDLNNDQVVFIE